MPNHVWFCLANPKVATMAGVDVAAAAGAAVVAASSVVVVAWPILTGSRGRRPSKWLIYG